MRQWYTYTTDTQQQVTIVYTERTYEITGVHLSCLVEGCGRMARWESPMSFGLHLRTGRPLLTLSLCPHQPMFTLEYGRGACPPWFTKVEKVAWLLS